MKLLTPKEYARQSGCTPQNITKKVRKYLSIEDTTKAKRYLLKALPRVSRIENPHIRCIMFVMKVKK
jgi:hypothetical protein